LASSYPEQPCAKARIKGAKAAAVSPYSSQGQAADRRFREGDDTLFIMLVSFRVDRSNYDIKYHSVCDIKYHCAYGQANEDKANMARLSDSAAIGVGNADGRPRAY
jgi:hypothetical protein